MALAISHRDRRLFERDDIANSIGIPVLASISVRHPSDAAEWTKLVEAYKPGAVDAWQLRMAMQQLGMTGHAPADRLHNSGSDLWNEGLGVGCFSLAVLCLSSDAGALALGPQLAVFASSLGIPTALVIGPQQDANPPPRFAPPAPRWHQHRRYDQVFCKSLSLMTATSIWIRTSLWSLSLRSPTASLSKRPN